MQLLGVINLKILLGKKSFRHEFLIVEAWDIPTDILLGIDFLVKHKIEISTQPLKFKINNEVIRASSFQDRGVNVVELHEGRNVPDGKSCVLATTELPGWSYGTVTLRVKGKGNGDAVLFSPSKDQKEAEWLWEGISRTYPLEGSDFGILRFLT